jgi:hypothetical protein
MDKDKQQRLESAGWTVGSADDFLGTKPLLKIPFSTTENNYCLYKLSKGRVSFVAQFWADSLNDVQRAVEAMYRGTDVQFYCINGEINANLEGICPADLDALDAVYGVFLNNEFVSTFHKGAWQTTENLGDFWIVDECF